jgi:hypothetical protein
MNCYVVGMMYGRSYTKFPYFILLFEGTGPPKVVLQCICYQHVVHTGTLFRLSYKSFMKHRIGNRHILDKINLQHDHLNDY